ncbi:MAG: DUF790 family protein [Oligosphaeraceae bacterium]
MLTPALVHALCRNGRLHPRFAPPDAGEWGERLIALYQDAWRHGLTAGELEEMLKPIQEEMGNPRLFAALRKLLEERCRYALPAEADYPALRLPLLQTSAQWLAGDAPLPALEEWPRRLQALHPQNPLAASGQLYGDLPENQVLRDFDAPTPRELVDRYNTGVVQALLLGCRSLEITLRAQNAPQLRRLCQYLRFFRLLAEIRPVEGDPTRLALSVDGPAAILEQGKRYGLQLALFFPALCTMPEWRISVHLPWRGRDALLELDQKSGLKCPYRHFAGCLPEEVRLFQDTLRRQDGPWELREEYLPLQGEEARFLFPDFIFQRKDTPRLLFLELFHRWHCRELPQRLEWLSRHPESPLVLGVERALLKRKEIAQALERFPLLPHMGFLYRDFPTVDKTLRTLEKRWQSLPR